MRTSQRERGEERRGEEKDTNTNKKLRRSCPSQNPGRAVQGEGRSIDPKMLWSKSKNKQTIILKRMK